MTTWTEVANQSTTFTFPSDEINDYVLVGYVENGYISGVGIWSEVDDASTAWA